MIFFWRGQREGNEGKQQILTDVYVGLINLQHSEGVRC
jgi:hypothetical protein